MLFTNCVIASYFFSSEFEQFWILDFGFAVDYIANFSLLLKQIVFFFRSVNFHMRYVMIRLLDRN